MWTGPVISGNYLLSITVLQSQIIFKTFGFFVDRVTVGESILISTHFVFVERGGEAIVTILRDVHHHDVCCGYCC